MSFVVGSQRSSSPSRIPLGKLSRSTSSVSSRGLQVARQQTPRLPDDVVHDESAATYVSIFNHNVGKAQRTAHLRQIKAVAADAVDQIGVETTLLDEERRHLSVLTSIASSLQKQFEDGEAREAILQRTLDSMADTADRDPAIRVLRDGLSKRQSERAVVEHDIKRKQLQLDKKHEELSRLRLEIERTEARAAAHASATQRQQTATLSEFLGLQSDQDGDRSKPAHPAACVGDSFDADKEGWLRSLRIRRGENLYEVFQESHANPLTMLLSPKANFGHRKDEARRMLETIMHLSPVKGSQESYNGASETALFDVTSVAEGTSALEAEVQRQRRRLSQRLLVLKDPQRLRVLDTFQRYEDPRGTIEHVATTPLDVLQKERQQVLQVFES